ncbi:MAG TPA: DUF1684 domain-containing protein, partial [Vicinamibacterales bacterium]
QRVQTMRTEKDTAFRTRDDSPIPAAARASFPGLPYFGIDPAYHVPAVLTLDPTARAVVIELPTSSTELRRMRKVGALGFTVSGGSYTLTAFVDAEAPDMRRLFVPFGDLTNGAETYKGGRYLDLDRTPTGLYDLDFNRAYHPYCVYDPSYVCPVPPRENRLTVAIKAGERLGPFQLPDVRNPPDARRIAPAVKVGTAQAN